MSTINIEIGNKKPRMLGAASFLRNLPLVKNRIEESRKGKALFTFEEMTTVCRVFMFLSLKHKKDQEKLG